MLRRARVAAAAGEAAALVAGAQPDDPVTAAAGRPAAPLVVDLAACGPSASLSPPRRDDNAASQFTSSLAPRCPLRRSPSASLQGDHGPAAVSASSGAKTSHAMVDDGDEDNDVAEAEDSDSDYENEHGSSDAGKLSEARG